MDKKISGSTNDNILELHTAEMKAFTMIDVKIFDMLEIKGNTFPIKHEDTKQNKPLKPPKTHKQMIKQFEENGVTFTEEEREEALELLKNNNYYRLSVFPKLILKELPLGSDSIDKNKKESKDVQKMSFTEVIKLYQFDEQLRILLIEYIFKIEIMLKQSLANYLALNYKDYKESDNEDFQRSKEVPEALCYLDYSIYATDDTTKVDALLSNYYTEIERKIKHEPALKHHIENYGGNIPIWVLIEVLTFGTLNWFITNLHKTIRVDWTNQTFNLPRPQMLMEMLKTLQFIRNDCAHGNRLYGKFFTFSPTILDEDLEKIIGSEELTLKNTKNSKLNAQEIEEKNKIVAENDLRIHTLFSGFLVVKEVLRIMDKRTKEKWNLSMKSLSNVIEIEKFERYYIGFPEDWLEILTLKI